MEEREVKKEAVRRGTKRKRKGRHQGSYAAKEIRVNGQEGMEIDVGAKPEKKAARPMETILQWKLRGPIER